jgi:hypothetical protein
MVIVDVHTGEKVKTGSVCVNMPRHHINMVVESELVSRNGPLFPIETDEAGNVTAVDCDAWQQFCSKEPYAEGKFDPDRRVRRA